MGRKARLFLKFCSTLCTGVHATAVAYRHQARRELWDHSQFQLLHLQPLLKQSTSCPLTAPRQLILGNRRQLSRLEAGT